MKTEDKARNAIQTMMSYIDANSEETDINVRCIVAEGLGKLMMFRRLHDFFCETAETSSTTYFCVLREQERK